MDRPYHLFFHLISCHFPCHNYFLLIATYIMCMYNLKKPTRPQYLTLSRISQFLVNGAFWVIHYWILQLLLYLVWCRNVTISSKPCIVEDVIAILWK
jgi:hypothetical protein